LSNFKIPVDKNALFEVYESYPYKPIRVRPRDAIILNYPSLVSSLRHSIKRYKNQDMGSYKQTKWNYLIELTEDFWFPSQTITPIKKFEPGGVKSCVQFELNKGWFDVWDAEKEYQDQWMDFDTWWSGYTFGDTTDISYFYLEKSNQRYLELEPRWNNSILYK
jgi:hypothetical protein